MIAYNRTGLDNKSIQDGSDKAQAAGSITADERAEIRAAYPSGFYTPNIFICMGLFLLVLVIAIFSLGLIFLLTSAAGISITPILLFTGLVCYGALEYVVNSKRHFSSGVDYALIWASSALLFSGLQEMSYNGSYIRLYTIIFILALFYTVRFANNMMALIAYGSLLAIIFTIASGASTTGKAILPFVLMGISLIVYFVCKKLCPAKESRHYRQCLEVVRATTLISFYLAGNYFVVRELSSYMSGSSSLEPPAKIPLGWLFWFLTVTIPLAYIYWGVRKKDAVFLWVGLVLVAATVFTVRYYYSVLPVEWAMMLGGVAMIVLAYGLTRYLKTPRNGFTADETSDKHVLENLHIESLVIAETFSGPAPTPSGSDFQFGGGSGGGGGAGGQY